MISQVTMNFFFKSIRVYNEPIIISPTFVKRLGKVSYNYLQIKYESKIADDNRIVDEKHNKIFKNALEWVNFIHNTYGITCHKMTAHEMFYKERGQKRAKIEI